MTKFISQIFLLIINFYYVKNIYNLQTESKHFQPCSFVLKIILQM